MSDNYNADQLRNAINILQRVLANIEGETNPLPRAEDGPPIGFDAYHEEKPPAENVELASPKQLAYIDELARERGLNAEVECRRVHKCSPGELPKRMASAFIDYLKTQGKGRRAA